VFPVTSKPGWPRTALSCSVNVGGHFGPEDANEYQEDFAMTIGEAGTTGGAGISRRTVLRTGTLAGLGAAVLATTLSAAPVEATAATINGWIPQSGWRWCPKCQGLFTIITGVDGRCPGGGVHGGGISHPYVLWTTDTLEGVNPETQQGYWWWCRKCQGLAYQGPDTNWFLGYCPGAGRHDHSGSYEYWLSHDIGRPLASNEQGGWRWCYRCMGLFFGANASSSWCPASTGARHAVSASFDYVLNISRSGPPVDR
jgi:hypothetical protein